MLIHYLFINLFLHKYFSDKDKCCCINASVAVILTGLRQVPVREELSWTKYQQHVADTSCCIITYFCHKTRVLLQLAWNSCSCTLMGADSLSHVPKSRQAEEACSAFTTVLNPFIHSPLIVLVRKDAAQRSKDGRNANSGGGRRQWLGVVLAMEF